jgi:hypothetical protein
VLCAGGSAASGRILPLLLNCRGEGDGKGLQGILCGVLDRGPSDGESGEREIRKVGRVRVFGGMRGKER